MKRNLLLLSGVIMLLSAPRQAIFAEDTGGELTVAFSSDEMTVDPLHAFRTDELQVATAIYEGLVSYNPENLRPVPGVAYTWDISEDGTKYTFHLRQRAKFSNGEDVLAEDFRDSWLRIINPDDEGEYSFLFDVIKGAVDYRTGRNRDPDSVGIRAVSPSVLEVELERPASHFLSMLPHMSFAPVHRSHRETTGWERRAPLVSNGPFTLTSWSAGELVFQRNIHYWDRRNVALDRIRIIVEPDPAQTARLLNEGTIQWADYAQTEMLQNRDLVQVAALFATSYLYFRADVEPWSNPLVRKGISLLIPWNELRAGVSSFVSSTLVPEVGFYDKPPALEELNVEMGLKLLAEAGFPNGRGLPAVKAVVTPGSVAEAVLEAAAKIWDERIALKTEIVPVSFNAYQEIARTGGYVIGASTWIGDFADPLSFLQMWTTGSKLNDAKYSSERYDSLVEQAMSENSEARYDMYAQAEALLLSDEVVVIPLANPPSVNFVDLEGITGWYANALDIHPFKHIRFKTPVVPKWYAGAPRGGAAIREALAVSNQKGGLNT
ncbi:MAG: peptide ABC transporter substrate-binding protein [Spirochaetales bacterium]|nr:peptide ABC transporter substrate-binding protein [Spirochaetales bacterium]